RQELEHDRARRARSAHRRERQHGAGDRDAMLGMARVGEARRQGIDPAPEANGLDEPQERPLRRPVDQYPGGHDHRLSSRAMRPVTAEETQSARLPYTVAKPVLGVA